MLGVARFRRVNFIAVQKFKGIEHGIGLLGAVGLSHTATRDGVEFVWREIALNQLTPEGKPFGDFAIGFQGRQREALETSFTVNQNAFMVAEIAELVWFYFVFLHFGKIHSALLSVQPNA